MKYADEPEIRTTEVVPAGGVMPAEGGVMQAGYAAGGGYGDGGGCCGKGYGYGGGCCGKGYGYGGGCCGWGGGCCGKGYGYGRAVVVTVRRGPAAKGKAKVPAMKEGRRRPGDDGSTR